MAKLGSVEAQILRIEGFAVHVLHPDGRNMRGDREGIPGWPYTYAAKDDWTVATWRIERFFKHYPGFEVQVLDGDRGPVAGNSKLSSVRESYF